MTNLSPYVLTTLTLSRQRLGMDERIMALPLALGGVVMAMTGQLLISALVWLISHIACMALCAIEPHIVSLFWASLRAPTKRRPASGKGAIYGA